MSYILSHQKSSYNKKFDDRLLIFSWNYLYFSVVTSRKSRNGDDLVLEEEEADTDLETDRLLGQQRTDDHGFYDDKAVRFPLFYR